MSRRGVAAAVGVDPKTIRDWIGRGKAFPTEEPWASFAVDYQRAERGLEGAAAGTIGLTAKMLFELTKRAYEGDSEAGERLAAQGPQLKELLNVLSSRFPLDWGQSKHREPESDFSASEYLDAHAMDREQLGALLCDPPELIRLALQDSAYSVYRILLEGGFDPAQPEKRKADDEGGPAEGSDEQGQMAPSESDAVEPGPGDADGAT